MEKEGMELLELMKQRHSIRKYTDERISPENLEKILQAGMLSPTGRNQKPWEFIVVREKNVLQQMSACRAAGAQMLEGADTAIVVIADAEKTDTWIEDCSIAMANMHLMAHSLGIGSCWIQGRLREAKDGQFTEDFLRSMLHYSAHYRLQAILSLGMPDERKTPAEIETLPIEKIHWEQY